MERTKPDIQSVSVGLTVIVEDVEYAFGPYSSATMNDALKEWAKHGLCPWTEDATFSIRRVADNEPIMVSYNAIYQALRPKS